jgi:hypothetical protein
MKKAKRQLIEGQLDRFVILDDESPQEMYNRLKKLVNKVQAYRPISLIHSFAKIVSKILANRLGPELKHLISHNQTTFIQDRCIHDSLAYVQGVIKYLHRKHTPALIIKLAISKAFDTAS